jgi:hypothetical protein
MRRSKKNFANRLFWLAVSFLISFETLARATPIHLTVQPKGSNQVELTFSPIMPDIMYNILVRSNGPDGHWMRFQNLFLVGNTNNILTVTRVLDNADGPTIQTLTNWTFVAGCWEDSDQDQLPDLYEELVSRTDPYSGDDGTKKPVNDGRTIEQKMESDISPFTWLDPYPPDNITIGFNTGRTATIRWRQWPDPTPEYFIIEKAERTPNTNRMRFPFARPGMPLNRTNLQGQPQPIPPFRQFNRPNNPNAMITGPYKFYARVEAAPVREVTVWGTYYHFTDTNADDFFQPLYRIQAHVTPPIHVVPTKRDASSIRETIRSVVCRPTKNGYDLTVSKPVAHAWYLLMVRDKNDSQWRASGYFTPEIGSPFHIHVDSFGMMATGDQKPIALPEVHHLSPVINPEFIAGCGEDSDGDGLPDIYEVLVTGTEPDSADTGQTGILDGFKETALDGWSNLENFRRRVNPLHSNSPPATVELKHPTLIDVFRATQLNSDFRYEPQVLIRTNGASGFSAPQMPLEMFYRMANPRDPSRTPADFDVLISWKVPEFHGHEFHNGQPVYQGP